MARAGLLGAVAAMAMTPALAQQTDLSKRPSLNFYGVPGLIDMPSGEALPDGEFAVSHARFGGISRTTVTFQFSPRISGSFRYSGTSDWNDVVPSNFDTYYDRSFDLRFLLLREGRYMPSVTLGLQDFVGTGLSSAEYLSATKQVLPGVKVTGGIGWGRLGTYQDIGTLFGDRPEIEIGEGGKFNSTQWFKGPIAPFAGIDWAVTEKLTFKAEYSSDKYVQEAGRRKVFKRDSPFNFGVEYQVNDTLRVGAYSLYGSEFGVMASVMLNPNRPPNPGVIGPAPTPVGHRPSPVADPDAWSPEWIEQDGAREILGTNLAKQLDADGLELEGLSLTARQAELRFRNSRYDSSAQAVGRVARAMTRALPASVETFRIVPVVNGVPAAAVTLRRSDVERLENAPNGAQALHRVATLSDGGGVSAVPPVPGAYPRFNWSFGPFVRTSLFDTDDPVLADLGLRLRGSYELAPGLVLRGSVSHRLFGNLDQAVVEEDPALPQVRSDVARYDQETEFALDSLTANYYFKASQDIYGRVTAGYLEQMFGGVSAELLWRPVESKLGLGAEINYARKRDYDGGFGFRDYDVITGHVSAYYDLWEDYQVQLDVGRYLAEDYGATLSVDREFANGWKVGAFATITDVSSEDFGDGSFDKGVRISMPLTWFTGVPNTSSVGTVVRPFTRDGGARLSVGGRLNETIREYHKTRLDAQWGRVWR
ncbi:hypothetical protein CCR78_06065 [Rhodovulum imhoffii]|nr:hypothetical protein [Rhodovulum imhoffii]